MAEEGWVGSWRPHRPRGPIAALYSSPGPKYGLPTNVGYRLHDPSRVRAPAYSFGLRGERRPEDRSPGPAYLLPPGTTVRGKDGTPAYSIYSRPRDLTRFLVPGPGCYSPERAERVAFPTAPACSLRSRTRQGSIFLTPGRGRGLGGPHRPPWGAEVRGSGVLWFRGATTCPPRQTPAPCTYRVVEADVYKRRAPQYSMLARNALPGDTTAKPGPGAYNPQQVRGKSLWGLGLPGPPGPLPSPPPPVPPLQSRPQGVTFGIRHSPYVAPLIVDVP
ncbi:ODF3A protein, partial [Trogon melanurus]|nr:ODF3A protein [Trogon melanurus]